MARPTRAPTNAPLRPHGSPTHGSGHRGSLALRCGALSSPFLAGLSRRFREFRTKRMVGVSGQTSPADRSRRHRSLAVVVGDETPRPREGTGRFRCWRVCMQKREGSVEVDRSEADGAKGAASPCPSQSTCSCTTTRAPVIIISVGSCEKASCALRSSRSASDDCPASPAHNTPRCDS